MSYGARISRGRFRSGLGCAWSLPAGKGGLRLEAAFLAGEPGRGGVQQPQLQPAPAPLQVSLDDAGSHVEGLPVDALDALAGVAEVTGQADEQPGRAVVVQPADPGEILGLGLGALLPAAAQPLGGEAVGV